MVRAHTSAALLLILLSACTPTTAPATGGSTNPTTPAEKRSANQELRFGQIGMPSAMTPEAGLPSWSHFGPMYDFLTVVDQNFNVAPQLAEKWTQVNPTTWRFTIRKGATFSNGDPVTIEDVEFSGRMIIDNKIPAVGQFANLTDVKVVDESNIDLITKIPDASVIPAGSVYAIMPKKYYASVGKEGFAAKPVGSGPYEIVEFRPSDMVSYKKRTTAHPFRKAQADKLTFRSITEQSQMIAGLRTGDLDAVIGTLSPDQVEIMKGIGVNVMARPSGMVTGLFSQTENQQRNSPLTNKQVRLAINYAVDKNAITKQLLRGYAEPIGQLSVPESPSWDPSVQPIPFDPAMAKRLLAEAGYPNGFKMTSGIEFTPFNNDPSIAQAIQANLRDVGIDAPVTSFEFATFLDKYYGRNGQTKGEIFMTSAGETNGFGSFIYGNYTCNKPLVWWCNQEFDKNMEAAAGEADIQKRAVLMRKASGALKDDVALLYLYYPQTFIVMQNNIKGFDWKWRTFNWDDAYRIEK